MEFSGVFLCEDMLIEIVEYLRIPEYYAFIRICKDIYTMRSKFYIKDYIILHKDKRKNQCISHISAIEIKKCQYYDDIIYQFDIKNIYKLYLNFDNYHEHTRLFSTETACDEYLFIDISYLINLRYLKCHGYWLSVIIGGKFTKVSLNRGTYIFHETTIENLKLIATINFHSYKNYKIKNLISLGTEIPTDFTVENYYNNQLDNIKSIVFAKNTMNYIETIVSAKNYYVLLDEELKFRNIKYAKKVNK